MFELSWTGRSLVGETDYEEGWERYPMPSGLAAIHQGMRDAHEADGRYTGMWEVQGLRQPLTGELIPPKLKSYNGMVTVISWALPRIEPGKTVYILRDMPGLSRRRVTASSRSAVGATR